MYLPMITICLILLKFLDWKKMFDLGFSFVEEDIVNSEIVSLEENGNDRIGVILYEYNNHLLSLSVQ